MRSPIRRFLPFALTAPLLALAAGAQPESDAVFVDRVDVNVVNVEVFVTDKSGRRVAGLGPADFEIYENDRPVEISNFYAVAHDDRLTQDLASDRDMLRSRRASTPGRREIPEDQQLNLLVYVDHFNLHQASQKRVLDDLEGFLEDRLVQGDNVMLVGYNRRVEIVQSFTRDRGKIADGLVKLRKVATNGQLDDAARRRAMRQMLPTPEARVLGNSPRLPGDDASSAYQILRSYVDRLRSDLRYSTSALESVARSLAGLPGRKALLYVSDGLPMRPGESLYQFFQDLYGMNMPASPSRSSDPMIEALVENESHLMNEIVRQANAHQVTFYTLYAQGPASGVLSAELTDDAGAQGVARSSLESMRTMNLQEPLIEMAEATGGASILNTYNFDDALGAMAADFDSFYSLGYRSHHGGDGKYHRIVVRVKRPGLEVRHRTGFVDKPEVERVADRTLSSLILEMEKNPLGVSVDFGLPKKQGGKYLVPILIRIPFREITLLPNGEVEQGQLRIFLAVQDEEGGISKTHEFPYPLTVPRDQVAAARDREIGYSTTLKIRRGVPKVAIGVWDELSGTESFVHKSLRVGEAKKAKKGP